MSAECPVVFAIGEEGGADCRCMKISGCGNCICGALVGGRLMVVVLC